MPSISTSAKSPGCIKTGGVRATPTPDGVPVKSRSPGSNVQNFDRCYTSEAIEKMNWWVDPSCMVSPLRRNWTRRFSA